MQKASHPTLPYHRKTSKVLNSFPFCFLTSSLNFLAHYTAIYTLSLLYFTFSFFSRLRVLPLLPRQKGSGRTSFSFALISSWSRRSTKVTVRSVYCVAACRFRHRHSPPHPPIRGQGEGEGGDSHRLTLQNTVPLLKTIFDPPNKGERKFFRAPPFLDAIKT